MTFIAKGKPPLLSALRTQCRLREYLLHASDHRRKHVEETAIFIRDDE
jgi:hypothetical protein